MGLALRSFAQLDDLGFNSLAIHLSSFGIVAAFIPALGIFRTDFATGLSPNFLPVMSRAVGRFDARDRA
jgi:hypothetical protein